MVLRPRSATYTEAVFTLEQVAKADIAQVASADVKAMFERAAQAGVSLAQAAKAKQIVLGKAVPAYFELFRRHGIGAVYLRHIFHP